MDFISNVSAVPVSCYMVCICICVLKLHGIKFYTLFLEIAFICEVCVFVCSVHARVGMCVCMRERVSDVCASAA